MYDKTETTIKKAFAVTKKEAALKTLLDPYQPRDQDFVWVFFGILLIVVMGVEEKPPEAVLLAVSLGYFALGIIRHNEVLEGLGRRTRNEVINRSRSWILETILGDCAIHLFSSVPFSW